MRKKEKQQHFNALKFNKMLRYQLRLNGIILLNLGI